MTRHAPPFRAEHIGSLLRPRALKDAVKARAESKLDAAGFKRIEDAAVLEAIRLQEECGLPSITDGEFRRSSWFNGFVNAVEGFGYRRSKYDFGGAHGAWESPYAKAPIRHVRPIVADDFAFVQANTKRLAKVTMPTPSSMHFYQRGDSVDKAVYPDIDRYFADLIEVYRAEIRALAAKGCRFLQLDEVPVAMLCDPAIRAQIVTQGDDPDALLKLYVDLFNAAIAERPASMAVGVHLCRGNYKGQWMASGGYEPVAKLLFGGMKADAFFLEYDSERAGDFSPLAHLPSDRVVILGLVTTKTPGNAGADEAKRRIEEASRVVPLDRLGISPQCGFASSVAGNPVTVEDQKRKLALCVEVAKSVWGTA